MRSMPYPMEMWEGAPSDSDGTPLRGLAIHSAGSSASSQGLAAGVSELFLPGAGFRGRGNGALTQLHRLRRSNPCVSRGSSSRASTS